MITSLSAILDIEPPKNCGRCHRLTRLRNSLRKEHPEWWNAPVPAFGDPDARLAIVGLAPGKEGANRTGRPFTGDASGAMLFAMLAKFGFLEGEFRNDPDDGVQLKDAIIFNAVKCLPPENRPLGEEIANCRHYLQKGIGGLAQLKVILALGKIAHDSVVKMSGSRLSDHKFAHGAEHILSDGRLLIDSYHCSRYNLNTGRLNAEMFEQIFRQIATRRQA